MPVSLVNRILQVFRRTKKPVASSQDIVLGVAANRSSQEAIVKLPARLRPQHLGILGLSGTGKTYLIEHLIRQDIQNRTGLVLFVVHGDLADSIVAFLAERAALDKEVYERTIIVEPFDPDCSFGFNPLELSSRTPSFLQAQE